MGQEFFINSQELETKVRQLLPSQGGSGAGFDLSASTQIVPIIDLTESAEGSNVRADLQTALSFGSVTAFSVNNTTTNIVTNTGYFRCFGSCSAVSSSSERTATINLTDGVSTKRIQFFKLNGTSQEDIVIIPFDFTVFLEAGHSLQLITNSSSINLTGATRQIADITGNLVDP